MNKKILILYAAIGLGHKSIAENIGFYLEQAGYEVKLADAQRVQGGLLAKWGKAVYQWVITHMPFIWEWLYKTEWFINFTLPFRTKVAAKNYEHIMERVGEFKPDAVICTHTTASAIMSYIKTKGLYKGKFIIAFSDFHLHRYWLYDNADGYLANIEEQKQEMVKLKIDPDKIFVCGITLKPKAEVDVKKIKEKFAIAEKDKVVLVSSGSQGFGLDEELITDLSKRPNTKVVVVCGNNLLMHNYLLKKFYNSKTLILHYHKFMDELYAVTDVFVTKAGALSISEALNWGLPILITHVLPGQEIYNYNYLTDRGLVITEPINILDTINEELDTASFKKTLSQNPALASLLNPGQPAAGAVEKILTKQASA